MAQEDSELSDILRIMRFALRGYWDKRKPGFDWEAKQQEFVPGRTKIPIATYPFGVDETVEALEAILSKTSTMGRRVAEFEKRFADYLGVAHAIMTNSGSSANLLAMYAIAGSRRANRLRPGDEVIVPAVMWATTLYPILNVGANAVLVDVDLDTYNIDVNCCREAIEQRTRVILPVHLLGNPCEITSLLALAEENNLLLLEDSCEALGAQYNGRKTGSFGSLATFSFYYSHHISTVEGGMVVTNDDEHAENMRSMREFGWIRNLHESARWREKYPDIDPRFMFVNIGFNLRPTDIQGGFGLHQLPKVEQDIEIRRENAVYWGKRLSKYIDFISVSKERAGTRHSWLGFPITVKVDAPFTRKDLTQFLESKGIETRPIMSGNMAEQPVLDLVKDHVRISGRLDNSRYIHRQSFFFGNHQGIGKAEREFIADSFDDFLKRFL